MSDETIFKTLFIYNHKDNITFLLDKMATHYDVIEIYFFNGNNMTFSGCEIKYAISEAEAQGYEIDDIENLIGKELK